VAPLVVGKMLALATAMWGRPFPLGSLVR
jgi:hypothetical protein